MFNTLKASLPYMIKRGNGGAVVNISSLAAIKSSKVSPAYWASKGGIIGLTLTLANLLSNYK